MDVYKDFFHWIRKLSLQDPCILIHYSIWPKLKEFVQRLLNIEFEDGKYHEYFGQVKTVVSSFMIYFKVTMDEMVKESDRCRHDMNIEELMNQMDNTIYMHQNNQLNFGKDYLPVNSKEEREAYEEIEQLYKKYMAELEKLKTEISKFDKQFKVDDFSKEHFKITVKKTWRLFNYTQSYIALMLADRVKKIGTSIEEVLLRMRNNLKRETETATERQHKLLNELYDKNKEQLSINRRYRKSSVDAAEVYRSIDILRKKIENNESSPHICRLKKEVDFWTRELGEFNKIGDVIKKLKTEQENCRKQENIYNKLQTTELPGSKLTAWNYMGSNYKCRQIYIKEKYIEAAQALLTFFACKGSDRVCYLDNIGRYYLDEYDHQAYPFDYALKVYHVDCSGQFHECPETDPYYFDSIGRYVYKYGEKIYQCAACTSQYKLSEDHLLKKVTEDCGHSETPVESCRMQIQDSTLAEMLPKTDPVDITNSLDPSVVKYLWESFGGLLPDALHDVAMMKPKNPIHILAHKLLWHKYGRTVDEVQKKTKEAREYRENVFKKRHEARAEVTRRWKSKQVKRRKPEESDDTDMAAYDSHVAQEQFINYLDYYN